MMQHGSSRQRRLAVDVAAVSPFELLRVVEGKYQPNVLNREHLLRKFKLSARCRVLLVSPTEDRPLERYWGHRRLHETAAALARLGQDTLGRAIHPIIIAGRPFVPECARLFETFTLVDSTPFMRALHRQRAYLQGDGEVGWASAPTPSGAPVDQLLSANIRTYEMSVALAAGRLHIHRQLMLPLEHSPAAAPM